MTEVEVFSLGSAIECVEKALMKGDYSTVRAVAREVLENDEIVGDRTDYHNLAVAFTKKDDYMTGYQIVRKGLRQYPYEIDLLADAIYYGSYCGRYEDCERLVERLMGRPRFLWNWRAFTFVADYYLDKMNWTEDVNELSRCTDNALTAAEEFQKCIPDDERGYSLEFKVREVRARFALLIDDDKLPALGTTPEELAGDEMKLAEQALKRAIDRTDMTASQCCLRYADYLLEHRRYPEVIECCKHAITYPETQPSARLSYVIFLSALSKDSLIHEEHTRYAVGENEELSIDPYEDEGRIHDVVSDYLFAMHGDLRPTLKDTIRQRCSYLQSRTDVEIPQELLFDINDEKSLEMSRLLEMIGARQS